MISKSISAAPIHLDWTLDTPVAVPERHQSVFDKIDWISTITWLVVLGISSSLAYGLFKIVAMVF